MTTEAEEIATQLIGKIVRDKNNGAIFIIVDAKPTSKFPEHLALSRYYFKHNYRAVHMYAIVYLKMLLENRSGLEEIIA